MDVIHLAKVSARIVFNSVLSREDLATQAREAVGIYDVVCAPCEVGHRIAFVHGYNAGLAAQEFEPNGKASNEIRALCVYSSRNGVVGWLDEAVRCYAAPLLFDDLGGHYV